MPLLSHHVAYVPPKPFALELSEQTFPADVSSTAFAYRRETFPHGMADGAEVAFEDNGALFRRGDP